MALVEAFSWALEGYAIDLILDAMKTYLRTPGNVNIPTPSEILAIIDPPKPKFKPDWAVYISIKNRMRGDDYVMPKEREYIKKCDNFAIEGDPDIRAQYQEAQSKLINYI